jgi:peptidoglycan/xylan/chitin deacetylase (PgdA/CDA1 family)
MRVFATGVLCLIGGVAAAVAFSFAPAAKPAMVLAQAVLPAAVEPAKSGEPADAAPAASSAPANVEMQKPEAPHHAAADASASQLAVLQSHSAGSQTDAAAEPAVTGAIAPTAAEQAHPQAKIDAVQAAITAAQPDVPYPTEPAFSQAAKTAAVDCPGHPDALGTSRVLTIEPGEFSTLGTINYKQTLPLNDHEVVLTFDDGPIPPYTNSVLDTLAANCVKATYFLVGEMAAPRPYLVRRIYNEGHSIGTHSQHHPFAFQRLSMARVESEVDDGIASVDAALGDAKALSPFFRIPGFGRTGAIDSFLERKGLITWSADVDTDDWWRGSTPDAIVERTMRRLNAKGRGIILMHDIHPATALALPILLKQLKANGYRVVHVVFAGEQPKTLPEVAATPIEKENWPRLLHADAQKAGPEKAALRRRVKLALEQHRHRRRHLASSKPAAHNDAGSSADRITGSY